VLSSEFDAEAALHRVLAHGDEEIADVLLHQEVLAGVGNVFKSETCFVARLNPFCRVAALGREQLAELIANARKLVAANVLEDSGDGIVTYGGRKRRTTHEADPGASLYVYGRKGEACRRCGDAIRSRLQGPGARVTFWCPSCQPMPDGTEVDG
jgi:endonuclease-8